MIKTISIIAVALISATIVSGRPPREAAKFDQFGDVCCDDEKARLDNFVNQLKNQPDAKGYIIYYGGRRQHYPYCGSAKLRLPRRGEAEARVARLRPYIVNGWAGFDPTRIVVLNGGYRETWEAELWIVPQGANPPSPTPTVKPESLRFRRGLAKKKDYHCEV